MSIVDEINLKAIKTVKTVSDDVLIKALALLDTMVKNDSDKSTKAKYNISRAWVSEELESRFDVNKVMNIWVENQDGRTYHQVLLQAVKDIIKKQNV